MKNLIGQTPQAAISEDMYGLFFEDINDSLDGGLYAVFPMQMAGCIRWEQEISQLCPQLDCSILDLNEEGNE